MRCRAVANRLRPLFYPLPCAKELMSSSAHQVKNGQQAFIIFPLIEKGEREEVKAAVDEHAMLQKRFFPSLTWACYMEE